MKKLNRHLIGVAMVALSFILLFAWREHRHVARTVPQPESVRTVPVAAAVPFEPVKPARQVPAQLVSKAPSLAKDHCSAFNSWAKAYLGAPTPQAKAELLTEGEELAKARREEMKQVIKSD